MATDTLDVPLLKQEIKLIWEEQQKHVAYIQDPPGVELYTVTRHILKGGVMLPVLRCARGFTSLESFHEPPSSPLCAWKFCWSCQLPGIHPGWYHKVELSMLSFSCTGEQGRNPVHLQHSATVQGVIDKVLLNTSTMHCVTQRSISSVNLFLERE